jgi:hypothetical protein
MIAALNRRTDILNRLGSESYLKSTLVVVVKKVAKKPRELEGNFYL